VLTPELSLTAKYNRPRFGAVGRMPWDVWVAQNQVLNREIIDIFGYEIPAVALARNKFERLERFLDGALWVLIGICAPILLDKGLNTRWTKGLIKDFNPAFLPKPQFQKLFKNPKDAIYRPVGIPFELLDKANRFNPGSKALNTISAYGLKSLPEKLADKLLNYKLLILWVDLLVMASKGQIYYWGKNWITEKWSGKKGFVGEFTYATDDYLKRKSAKHEQTKKTKQYLSLIMSYGSASLLPALLWGLLKSKTPAGRKNLIGTIKRVIPALNYFHVVYMSRWVMLWHNFFNWNLLGLIAARDSHELRETATKMFTADFFGFVADDVFKAFLGKFLQHRYKDKLKGIPLVKKGVLGIPRGISLHEFEDMAKRLTHQKQKDILPLAQKLIRINFWSSLAFASLGMGVTVNLLNNWYTKQKVLREQAEEHLKQIPKLASP